jgi:hypothetical protein
VCLEFHHSAQSIIRHQLPYSQKIRIPSTVLVYANQLSRLLGDVNELLCLCGGGYEWLFDQNVLAGFEGGFREGKMGVGCGGDDYNVD